MNVTSLYRTGLAALLLWLPTACQELPGVRPDDPTGSLSEMQGERPGDVYAQMGREYMKQGQPSIALVKLKKGLAIDPGNAQIHATLGRLYEQLGEARLAEENYRKATGSAPKDPYIRNAFGSFLCQQGQYDAADEQFHLALRNPLYEQPWAANTNAGVCALRADHVEKAENYLLAALSSEPRIPLALQKMASINHDRGEFDTAKLYIERYRELAPHTPETLLLGVKIEKGLGDKDGMARYLAVLENRFPDSPETRTAKELSQ